MLDALHIIKHLINKEIAQFPCEFYFISFYFTFSLSISAKKKKSKLSAVRQKNNMCQNIMPIYHYLYHSSIITLTRERERERERKRERKK
jgi:hypothetical protein